MRFAWDDVAVFLALLRHGTTSRAAQALGCSQPTVVRRIAAFEAALDVRLFDRTGTGLVATAAAEELRATAEGVEQAVHALDGEAEALRDCCKGTIRMTLLDHFESLVAPVLHDFSLAWPNIAVEILSSDRLYDLKRGEADVAVRGGSYEPDDAIVVRDLPQCSWALYGSARKSGTLPKGWHEVGEDCLALFEGPAAHLPIYRHVAAIAAAQSGQRRCNSYAAMRALAASGTALAALPVTVGDGDPDLVRCFPPEERFSVPIFLMARRSALRRFPVRALFDILADHFARHPDLLTGRKS